MLFRSDVAGKKEKQGRYETLQHVEPDDLIKYGLIPELVGRLPVVAALEELDEQALVDILYKPANALVKQYQYMFREDGVELKFTRGALKRIAQLSKNLGTGARGLRSITEKLLLNYMYELPTKRESGTLTVDAKEVSRIFSGSIVPFSAAGDDEDAEEHEEMPLASPAPHSRRKEGQLELPSAEPEVAG